MIIIKLREREHIDKALRRYKKKQKNTRLREMVREHQYYMKPSTRRRREVEAAKYKVQKTKD